MRGDLCQISWPPIAIRRSSALSNVEQALASIETDLPISEAIVRPVATFVSNLGITVADCRRIIADPILDGSSFMLDIDGGIQSLVISSLLRSRDELTVQCEGRFCFVTLHLPDDVDAAAQATILYKRRP